MNFGIYPQGIYPQLAITAITVSGTEIGDLGSAGERFVDNKRIEGTISEMVESALLFCKRNMKVKTIIDPATGLRKGPYRISNECSQGSNFKCSDP